MRRSPLIITGVVICIGIIGATAYAMNTLWSKPALVFTVPPTSSVSSAQIARSSSSQRASTKPTPIPDKPKTDAKNPPSVLIDVPFTSQAPFANWDALHEEACEEAALIMVQHFLNQTSLNADQSEKEIQDMVAWETDHGYGIDVTAEQLGKVGQDKLGLNYRVLKDPTEDSLKKELASGHPVILTVAGRMLKNPYFSGEGPWYHALVVVGYRDTLFGTRFITNDPGTKRGKQYEYSSEILLNAIHDWTGVDSQIAQGPKRALVVER